MKHWQKLLISVFVLFILITQALASVRLVTWRAWPFMVYGMYCTSHKEGDTVPGYKIKLVLDDGSIKKLTTEDLNLNFWFIEKGLIQALRYNDEDNLMKNVRLVERKMNVKIKSVRLEDSQTVIVKNDYYPGETVLVNEINIDG